MSELNKQIYSNSQVNAMSIEEIRSGLLKRLEHTLYYLLPNGRTYNNQFHVGNIQGDKGESLKVELVGSKAGLWQDFATGESGDIFTLWSKVKCIDSKSEFPKVIEDIKEWLGIYTSFQSKLCSKNNVNTNDNFKSLAGEWHYLDQSGKNKLFTVRRYNTATDGKDYSIWDHGKKDNKTPEKRPLYNLSGIVKGDKVILVEGEKCAQSLIDNGICATTAMCGAKASLDKTDWLPLKGKEVIIWPDNDKPGKSYAQSAYETLIKIGVKSVKIIDIPEDKTEKWDAADAVEEGINSAKFIEEAVKIDPVNNNQLITHAGESIWNDNSAYPADIIYPNILPPESLLVFAGAPKVGKTDFLMTWMVHMAAGISFMGMTPNRPLKVFYLQAELSYNSFRKRLQKISIASDKKLIAEKNFAMTPKLCMQLNEGGVDLAYNAIKKHFDNDVDIIIVDPLRNFFDGGTNNASENDNVAMLSFLQKRLETLRNKLNPKAGIILVHHTRKITKSFLEEETFQALSGASALRGYYTTGIILCRPDEKKKERQLIFELREGEEIEPKTIQKIVGGWQELEPESVRLIQQKHGQKLDSERLRKREVILQLIDEKAAQGSVYTMNQFCEEFENKAGLGGHDAIRNRLKVLSTKGHIKFFKDVEKYPGLLRPIGTKFGYMCVKDMHLKTQNGNEILVYPTEYKCKQTGAALPVEDPKIWVCSEDLWS